MKKSKIKSGGFTYVEAILYVAIVSLMLTTLIPFAWNVIEGGSKSAVQQEVSSNARYISERIKYEIRNSFGINSFSSSQISLCTANPCSTTRTITYSSPNVTIRDNAGPAVNLNSNSVRISNFSFTDNTSADNKTLNISFVFTVTQTYSGARSDFKSTAVIQSSAEVRSN